MIKRTPAKARSSTRARSDTAGAAALDSGNASTPETRPESTTSGPSEEDIRLRAYHRYLERGGRDGMAFEDWLEAERELKTQK
jgi:hypothetical protein